MIAYSFYGRWGHTRWAGKIGPCWVGKIGTGEVLGMGDVRHAWQLQAADLLVLQF